MVVPHVHALWLQHNHVLVQRGCTAHGHVHIPFQSLVVGTFVVVAVVAVAVVVAAVVVVAFMAIVVVVPGIPGNGSFY